MDEAPHDDSVEPADSRIRRFWERSLQRHAIDFGQWIVQTGSERAKVRGHPALRPAHSNIFTHMDPSGSRMAEIARAQDVSKNAIGQLVDELEDLGYVERVPDPTDGRAKILRYGEKGIQLLIDAMEIGEEIKQDLASMIGDEKLALLDEILEEIAVKLAARRTQNFTEPTGTHEGPGALREGKK
ncbi:MarR family winged helix-turn-helix transcriptional regulator [Frankia sp. AiPs1]|nr:MarR family winged helix-turn-helix transcriptional regulator [Frankia sp. AiPs1]